MKRDFLEMLMQKGALRIAPDTNNLFLFKSGRKSPNFINIGALTDGESLLGMKKAYSSFIYNLLRERKMEEFDFIFGPAYKGINLACLACEGLAELGTNVRYLYDRKEVKDYGDRAADEVIVGAGYFKPGSKILLIDDVITTGATKLDALEKLKVLGPHKVVGLIIAVDRQERISDDDARSAVDFIQAQGIRCFPIVNMEDIFSFVKDSLPQGIRESWISYYDKYGTVKL